MVLIALVSVSDCRRSAPPPPMIPTSGLVLWLRADHGVVLHGGTVRTWSDQSGNGNDALQQVSELQPRFLPDAINGKPAIHFHGAHERLGLTGTDKMSSITLFVVIKMDSGAAMDDQWNVPMILGNRDDDGEMLGIGTNNYFIRSKPDTLNVFTAPNRAVRVVYPRCVAIGEWKLIAIAVDKSLWHTVVRVNGATASGIPVGVNMSLAVPLGNSDGTSLGGLGGTGRTLEGPPRVPDYELRGMCDIAELIVYNTALTDSTRQVTERHLCDKYALEWDE